MVIIVEPIDNRKEDYFKVRYIGGNEPPIFTEGKIYPAAYPRGIEQKNMTEVRLKIFAVADDMGQQYFYMNSMFEILRDENGNPIPWTDEDGDVGE